MIIKSMNMTYIYMYDKRAGKCKGLHLHQPARFEGSVVGGDLNRHAISEFFQFQTSQ